MDSANADGCTCFHDAAYDNRPDLIQLYVTRGKQIDSVDEDQFCALHVAISYKRVECAKKLIQLNCNVNLQDFNGFTPLHYAIAFELDEIVDAICQSGRADFMIQNNDGFNALHYAALKRNNYAVQCLMLKAHHLLNVKAGINGYTALHVAATEGCRNVAVTLLSHQGERALINLQTNYRLQTPLHQAVMYGHWSIVELLLQHNADITTRDKDGNTVLHIAINECKKQANIALTAGAEHDAPRIYAVWQELSRRGAGTELALVCFLVSQDTSGMMLERVKNRHYQTPIDLLLEDSKLAPFIDTVQSYKVQPTLHKETVLPCETNSLNTDNGISSRSESCQICQDSQFNNDILMKEIEEEKEFNMCRICLEQRIKVAFLCGHSACGRCAAPLTMCHMCRQSITKKINLYN